TGRPILDAELRRAGGHVDGAGAGGKTVRVRRKAAARAAPCGRTRGVNKAHSLWAPRSPRNKWGDSRGGDASNPPTRPRAGTTRARPPHRVSREVFAIKDLA